MESLHEAQEENKLLREANATLQGEMDSKHSLQDKRDSKDAWQEQNQELMLTVQMLIKEKQELQAENKHISEIADIFEKKYEEIAGQNARMMGHINHKQKIQHTLQLKQENAELRQKLSETTKLCCQLESGNGNKRLDELFNSFALYAGATSSSADGEPTTPGRSRKSTSGRRSHDVDDQKKIDLQHLIALIQGVVMENRGEEGTGDMGSPFERLRDAMQKKTPKQKSEGGSRSRSRSIPRLTGPVWLNSTKD